MSLNLDKSTWKTVQLKDVVVRSNRQVKPVEAGVERYVAGGHFDSGSPTVERWGDPDDGGMGSTFTYAFRPGQVLFLSARPNLRKVGVPDFAGVVADKTYVLDAIPDNGLSQRFLPFVLLSEPFLKFAVAEATGSMNPRLLWGTMQRYEFEIPQLDEQERLADLLWSAERSRNAQSRARESHESLISQFCLAAYKQAAAEFPGGTISDLGELRMGRQKSPRYSTGVNSKPYLRVANIGNLELLPDATVEEMDFNESDYLKFHLQAGDILLTEGDIVSAMNVGRPALFLGEIRECCFQNTLIRFRPSCRTDPYFALAIFEGMRIAGVFAGAASTTTVTHLGLKRLSMVPIPLVPEIEQVRVGAKVSRLLEARQSIRDESEAIEVLRRRLSGALIG